MIAYGTLIVLWKERKHVMCRFSLVPRLLSTLSLHLIKLHRHCHHFHSIYHLCIRWSCDRDGNEYVIVELVEKGSLDAVLSKHRGGLKQRTKLAICEQICSAMCELVREGVVHRDLAARNVLVQSLKPVHVKVAYG